MLWITFYGMFESFFKRLRPADIIGLVTIIGGFILLFNDVDTIVGGLLIAVVTYYFVRAKHDDNTKDS